MKILYIANFGDEYTKPNGQSAKANQLINALAGKFKVKKINSNDNFFFIFIVFFKALLYRKICVTLGRNGIFFVGLLLYAIKKIFFWKKYSFIYIVAGGWVADFYKEKTINALAISAFDTLLVETDGLSSQLINLGLNAKILRNFRDLKPLSPKNLNENKVRLVFFSRVRKDKGIFYCFNILEKLLAQGIDSELHFYGPFEMEDKDSLEFTEKIKNNSRIFYHGYEKNELSSAEIINLYDFLLLPTYYIGECIPGAVVESFYSGTPVIVSDWKYMPELVNHGKVGWCFSLDSIVEKSVVCIDAIINKEQSYYKMSESCIYESQKYSLQSAMKVLDSVFESD